MDRRLTPCNGRVAHVSLQGQVRADRFVEGDLKQVQGSPFLFRDPNGPADRQLLWGDQVRVLEAAADWYFIQSLKDGYVGYMRKPLGDIQALTHRVQVRTSWAYDTADFKQRPRHAMHFGSAVQVVDSDARWSRIDITGVETTESHTAYLPSSHLRRIDEPVTDPVEAACLFLGTPYVWAGNSGFGIDCSGLVQAALLACGIACPGDSDLQEKELGTTLPKDTPPRRGDLMFWKGHVAMVVDADTLIHANAFHMSVAFEPIREAVNRISAQGNGPVTRHARLT